MITAYFVTYNGHVLDHEFGKVNLDRRANQMFVNRNNAAVARRGDHSKPYAILTVEFRIRPLPLYYAGQELGTGLWCVQEFKVGGPRCSTRYVGDDAQQQAEQKAAEMNAEAERPTVGTVECQTGGCGQTHTAEYSHVSQHGSQRVFAVVCGDLVDYYTEDVVTFPALSKVIAQAK